MLVHNNTDKNLSRTYNRFWSKGLIFGLLLALLADAWPIAPALSSVRAVSRTTTISVCDEPHLLAALNIGGDITFGCSGVITLTTTPISGTLLSLNTSLDATGQNVTLDGGGARGIFLLNGSGVTLTVKNLTFSHATGAIHNVGANVLNIVNSTFSNNATFNDITAGQGLGTAAISDFQGTLNITNSLFISNTTTGTNGGAISLSFDTTNIVDSTFIGNSNPTTFVGSEGGAIFNNGSLVVRSSTFSGNQAGTGNGFGGAIANELNLTVINSTFYNNNAKMGAAIFIPGPNTSIINSTIVANTGSAAVEFEAANSNVVNSIIANNPVGNCHTFAGVVGGHNNLESGTTGTCGTGSILTSDPRLGPLANSGGPTQTMALLAGSSAMDAADNTICQAAVPNGAGGLDQRGTTRPQGNGCDIGAFEAAPSQNLPAPSALRASPFSPTRIDLNWQDNSTTETAFSLERRTSATAFSSVITLPTNTTAFSDTTVSPDTLYVYRVQALQNGIASAYSNEITVTTGAPSLVVTLPTDDGAGTLDGTLSAALVRANSGQVITFNLSGEANAVVVSGQLPSPGAGVTIDGGSCVQGPRITLDGSTAPASATGLRLNKGAVLKNLKIKGFKNKQLVVLGGNGSVQTSCVVTSAR